MGGFDNRTAIFLAAACSQSYAQFNDPNGEFAIPRPFEPVGEIRAKSLLGIRERFGFVLQSDTHAIVAFRGTSTTSDWVSDALASQIKPKFVKNAGRAHRGFTELYSSARSDVLACLERVSSDKTLCVTGHSLGGALATLCALDVSAGTKFRQPVVYTYGAPRVGDPAFVKAYESRVERSFRVHNAFDPVTYLPPLTLTLPKSGRTYDYKHARRSERLVFHHGSVPGNHAISGYYSELARRDPMFAERLSAANPGFCPSMPEALQAE
ncbi:lipase family protein [Cohnella hongkongensis]|uniref:Lipase family protein n=1 Tax=Cohnella hongkongensis TaxID=178337 RepID=A0ABV9FFL3_9BACL